MKKARNFSSVRLTIEIQRRLNNDHQDEANPNYAACMLPLRFFVIGIVTAAEFVLLRRGFSDDHPVKGMLIAAHNNFVA